MTGVARTWRGGLVGLLSGLVWLGAAGAADPTDPDWPCIQRLVPRISAGMVWAGPPVEDVQDAWEADPDVAALVGTAASRTTTTEQAAAAIEAFAAGLTAEKDLRLTRLFAGLLETINDERTAIIEGIRRYTRRQGALADKIERRTEELNRLAAETSAEAAARRADLEEEQVWDQRIFEERQRSLTYLCDQPVNLDQRLFALSRAIMAHLD